MTGWHGQVGRARRVVLASSLVGTFAWIALAEPPASAVDITRAVEWSDHGDWHSPRMLVRNGHLMVHALARAETSASITLRIGLGDVGSFNLRNFEGSSGDLFYQGAGQKRGVGIIDSLDRSEQRCTDYPQLVDVVDERLYVFNLQTTDVFPEPNVRATLTGGQTNVILYDACEKTFRNLTRGGLAHGEPYCETRALRVFHEERLILVVRVNISLVEPVGEPIPGSARTEFLRISDGSRVPFAEGPARARAWLDAGRAVREDVTEERVDGQRWVVWTLHHRDVDGDPVVLRRQRDDGDRDDVSPPGGIVYAVDPERRLYVASMRGAGTYLIDFTGRREKICDEAVCSFDEHSRTLFLRTLVERGGWRVRRGEQWVEPPPGERGDVCFEDRYRYWALDLSPWLRPGVGPEDE